MSRPAPRPGLSGRLFCRKNSSRGTGCRDFNCLRSDHVINGLASAPLAYPPHILKNCRLARVGIQGQAVSQGADRLHARQGRAPYAVQLDPREAVFLAGNGIDLDPFKFGRHALRRTKALLSYRRKGNLRAVQLLLSRTTSCPRTFGRSQGVAIRSILDSVRSYISGDGSPLMTSSAPEVVK